MNLGDFTQLVRDNIKRGSAYDSIIPFGVASAALYLETNYSFKYMERFVSFSLSPDGDVPRALAQPSPHIKSIAFMRVVLDDGSFRGLSQIDPQQVSKVETAAPTAYWLDGAQYIWFDNTPDQLYTLEMSFSDYTPWPTDASATPWLLAYAAPLMLAQTMLELAPTLRTAPELVAMYKTQRDAHLAALLGAEEALRAANRSSAMLYGVNSNDYFPE